jgi:D-alanine-D-alanine ligase
MTFLLSGYADGLPRYRIAVIGGGQSCEHEVSLASAASVGAALEARGHKVLGLTIGRDGTWVHGQDPVSLGIAVHIIQSCDAVLPAVHGPRGEDGTLAALCELAGVPYVGSGVGAGALAMDKWVTKLVAQALGIQTAHGLVLHRADRTFELADRVLVEDVAIRREVDIAVLARPDGSKLMSPPLEIVTDGNLDFATTSDGGADFRIPAALTAHQRSTLEASAYAMYDALGCRGVARIDFFLTDDGWLLNEVSTMPGMTEASRVPTMFEAAGIGYADLIEILVRGAVAAP